jgi:hypothetical protein
VSKEKVRKEENVVREKRGIIYIVSMSWFTASERRWRKGRVVWVVVVKAAAEEATVERREAEGAKCSGRVVKIITWVKLACRNKVLIWSSISVERKAVRK